MCIMALSSRLIKIPIIVHTPGADPGLLKRGEGQLKETFLQKVNCFFKANQCSFSGHGFEDDYNYQQYDIHSSSK